MDDIQAFIRRLPKAELHLHLEGTITPATLVELSPRHDAQPLALVDAEALYRFADFTGFIEAFKAVTRLLSGAGGLRTRCLAHDAAPRRAGRGPRRGLYLRRSHLHVAQYDPRAFEPIFAGLERARQRAESELGLSLLDLRRRAPLHRG